MKKEKIAAPFGVWLRKQAHRADAVGRIALDVIGEENRLGRQLRCLEDRANFSMFVRAMPREVGVTFADGLACWKEWAATLQQQEVR
jgi:hypothetical protein